MFKKVHRTLDENQPMIIVAVVSAIVVFIFTAVIGLIWHCFISALPLL